MFKNNHGYCSNSKNRQNYTIEKLFTEINVLSKIVDEFPINKAIINIKTSKYFTDTEEGINNFEYFKSSIFKTCLLFPSDLLDTLKELVEKIDYYKQNFRILALRKFEEDYKVKEIMVMNLTSKLIKLIFYVKTISNFTFNYVDTKAQLFFRIKHLKNINQLAIQTTYL